MKTIIIDGNNLIHKDLKLRNLFKKEKEASQRSLMETVKSRLGRGDKVIFVFDGFGSIQESAQIIFSRERTADELIRKKIEDCSEPKKLVVISSDSGITDLARICGCQVKRSEDFLKEIHNTGSVTDGKNINMLFQPDSEKPERSTKKDLEEFRRHFT